MSGNNLRKKGKKEPTLGLTNVGISRFRNLSSLVMEPMTFKQLGKIKKSVTFRLKEEFRLKELYCQRIKINWKQR